MAPIKHVPVAPWFAALRLVLGFGLLAGLMFFVRTAAAQEPRTPQELKNRAFDLWNAGEFDRATELFGQLAALGAEEPLARTADFHLGNLLESDRIQDALTASEAADILRLSEEAYRRALVRMQGGPPGPVAQLQSNLRRVQDRRAKLGKVLENRLPLVEAAETLDDAGASAAAAAWLEPHLDPAKPDSELLYYLSSVYLTIYLDNLYRRLNISVGILMRPDQDLLGESRLREQMDRLRVAAQRAEANGEAAIEHFPQGPHLLDFYVLMADAHRYHGALELTRAAWLENRMESAGTRPAVEQAETASPEEIRTEARAQFELSLNLTHRLIETTERALADPSILSSAQKSAYPPETLNRLHSLAADTLPDTESLLRRSAGDSGQAVPDEPALPISSAP